MARQSKAKAPPGRKKKPGRERPGKRRVCIFCTENLPWVDYKDAELLRRFISERAKIRARRVTGNCAQHQREVSQAIKLSRELALLAYAQRQVTVRKKGGRGEGRGPGGPSVSASGPPPSPSAPPPPPRARAEGEDDDLGEFEATEAFAPETAAALDAAPEGPDDTSDAGGGEGAGGEVAGDEAGVEAGNGDEGEVEA
jgi:small subunit ribosomal protein S18